HELLQRELFGPLVAVFVYDDARLDDAVRLCDQGSVYALTGAVFAQDEAAISQLSQKLRFAAGNFYVNDKPTGAIVGQQPFGGSPLLQTPREQASALSKRLEAPVLVAMRLWEPGVEQALAGAAALGLSRMVVIALAPFSQHVYWDAALKVATAAKSSVQLVPS